MSDINNPPYKIGDEVWAVHVDGNGRHEVTCPICFGKRVVTLILGNGEHVESECGMCALGYDSPRGVVGEYGANSRITPVTVTGLSWDGDDWCVSTTAHLDKVFSDKDEAEAFRAVEHDRQAAISQKWWEDLQISTRKGVGWTVGYARTEIKKLRRSLEYHESKIRTTRAAKTT